METYVSTQAQEVGRPRILAERTGHEVGQRIGAPARVVLAARSPMILEVAVYLHNARGSRVQTFDAAQEYAARVAFAYECRQVFGA